MAKKDVEERELTGGEIVVAAIILILALYVIGNASDDDRGFSSGIPGEVPN